MVSKTPNGTFDPKEVFDNLDVKQKVSLLCGLDFWHTNPLPEHKVPAIRLSDGSSGIRGTRWFEGVRGAAIPCGTALAATWDRDLLYQAGVLLGNECRDKGVHCWLGPTINIQRSPLGGRGYESYSEDPYLSGILASDIIKGCESTGVIATPKHFICNDQEDDKRALNAILTERALREIYLRPFQLIAREAAPGALMASYNKVNGTHVSESKRLLDGVVRKEWGWDPLIMSDWYGTYSTIAALDAGLDLEMPGETKCRGQLVELALSSKLIKASTLDRRVRKILEFIHKSSQLQVSNTEKERDLPEDRELNLQLARNSIVLLKNENSILPIPRHIKKIALIGSHMKDSSMNSSGATALEPYYTVHPLNAMKEKLGKDVEIKYEVGAYTHKMLPLLDGRLTDNVNLFLFNEPSSVISRKEVDCIRMGKTFFQLLDYLNPELNMDTFYGSLEGNLNPDEDGEWDFGLAVHGTGKLFIDDTLVVDNSMDQVPGKSFFSRGTTEKVGTILLKAGHSYRFRVEFGSASTSTLPKASDGSVSFGGGGARLGACPRISTETSIERAVQAASISDYAVICTGLNGEWETEGHDRSDMELPPHVDDLISRVAAACPRTVVINRTGMPVSMPWASHVPAILQAWYGGNETGSAIADVLFGDFNPCGKMPISWPKRLKDNPAYLNFGSNSGRVLFGEDIFVGYRWYEKMEIEPLWRFGHGLSYTTFIIRQPTVSCRELSNNKFSYTLTVEIENTGNIPGVEVLQAYVSALDSTINRPKRELHGFKKVELQAMEKKAVIIDIDQYALSYWDEAEDRWCQEKGRYEITVRGGSSITSTGSCIVEAKETSWWSGL